MSRKFLSPLGLLAQSTNPASGSIGDTYYNTSDNKVYTYNGSSWVATGLQGIQGTTGSQGTTGAQGTQGLQGTIGSTGAGGTVGYWGSFWSTATQNTASTSATNPVTFNNTDTNSTGVSIVSSSRVTFAYTGTYNIQFSAQVNEPSNGNPTVDFWLRKNGVNVPETTGTVNLTNQIHYAIAGWNYVLNLTAGDYVELVWAADATAVQLLYIAAQTSPHTAPATPSVILTATQVAYGIQGIQGTQGISGASILGTSNTFTADNTIAIASGTSVPLTITNNGTGNSLVVNDATSPTSPFVITDAGNVGIGTSSTGLTTNKLSIYDAGNANVLINGDTSAAWTVYRSSTDTGSPAVNFRKARGTTASKTAISSGDGLGFIGFAGYDGTNAVNGASMYAAADSTVSTGIVPGRLVIETANTSGVLTERMRITSAGLLLINSSSSTLGFGSVASQFGVVSGAATTVGQVIRGAASQTANLTEWQDSSGNILASMDSNNLTLQTNLTTGNRGLTIRNSNSAVSGAILTAQKSRGTNTSPTVVATGDLVAAFSFSGYNGTTYPTDTSLFGASVTGVSGSVISQSLYFTTGASGSGNYIPSLLIHHNGGVGIGSGFGNVTTSLTAPIAGLQVNSYAAGTPAIVARPFSSGLTATITNAVQSAGTVTYTATNTFSAGQQVTITGITPTTYNVTNATIKTATGSNFTVSNASLGGTYSSGGTATAYANLQEWQTNAGAAQVAVNQAGYVTTLGTELVLEQTGDGFGGSRLRLQNRTGQNGPLFDTSLGTVDLVDFGFKSISSQGNIRYEARGYTGGVTVTAGPEFQIGNTGLTTATATAIPTSFPLIIGTGLTDRRVIVNSTTGAVVPLTIAAAPATASATITGATVTTFTNKTGTVITPQGGSVSVSRITGIASTTGLLPGMILTRVSGVGTFGGGTASIVSVDTATSLTVYTTAASVAGSVTFSIQNSVAYTATNTFSQTQNVTITGATAAGLNVANAFIGAVSGSTFTIINTTASGTWSSGGTATITQSANLTQWIGTAGTVVADMDSSGNITAGSFLEENSSGIGQDITTMHIMGAW